jgi:hypothetical protein
MASMIQIYSKLVYFVVILLTLVCVLLDPVTPTSVIFNRFLCGYRG